MDSHDSPRLSVVIPALNEAPNIGHVLRTLPEDVFEVILVDGHSTDGTVDVARAIRSDIRVVVQPGTGMGDALAAGFAACRGDVVVMLSIRSARSGLRVTEVPSLAASRLYGRSNLRTVRDGFRMLRAIFCEWRAEPANAPLPAGAQVEPAREAVTP